MMDQNRSTPFHQMTSRVEATLDSYAIAAVSDRDSALTDLLAAAMLVHGREAVEAHIAKARMHYEDEVEDAVLTLGE